jgi:hypothetical protein
MDIFAGQEGVAHLTLRFNDQKLIVPVNVDADDGTFAGVASQPVGVSIPPTGNAGTLYIDPGNTVTVNLSLLNAPAETDVTMQVQSRNPAMIEVDPTTAFIPAGSREAEISITATSDGNAETYIDLYSATWHKALHVIIGIPEPDYSTFIATPPVGIEVEE